MATTSVLRKEDRRLLTGAACFVDDLQRPGMLHAAVLRSAHGHARVMHIDVAAALAHPGVVDVITASDLPAELPRIPMRMFTQWGMERFLQAPLADEVVRYSGEPLAVVVADSRYAAEDGAELIEVEYAPLPAVVDAEAAIVPGAPVLHEHAETNVAAEFEVSYGDADAVFDAAHTVVEARIVCHRHAAVPLETRGLVAESDPATGTLTVWGAAKIVHVNRALLATMLGWSADDIRFVELDVGGGFGARGEFYPEDFLIPWCALRLGRPVAWTEDREEHLRATNHSREQIHDIALALSADGTFLALRDHVINNTGAYVRTHGTVVPGMTAGLLPGPYRFDAYRCVVQQVVTNKTPAGTYRAPGRYEAGLARERLIDMAARRLGQDPLELRHRNLIPADAMPYSTGTTTDAHPVVYDSGDYALLIDKAAERFDMDALRRWRAEPAVAGRRRGLGTALFVEKSGIGRWEYAQVGIDPDGDVIVQTGAASLGQGVETVLAQICAEHLGCGYTDVEVRHGDTASVPYGMGSFGSRATTLAGAAVMRAAAQLADRVRELAAEELEAAPEDIEIVGREARVRGVPTASISFADLAAAAPLDRAHSDPASAAPPTPVQRGASATPPPATPAQRDIASVTSPATPPPTDRPASARPALADGGLTGLAEEALFNCDDMAFPYGLHIAAVEVDVETGAVDIHRYAVAYDVGRAINPMLVDGQIVGGVAQGVGGALYEELAYDADGQLVSGSFMDYLLPTAVEAPPVDVLVTEDAPSPLNPLGVKGAGEGGTSAAGGVIANAVSDALGIDANRLPLSPARVVALAGEAGLR